MHGARPHGAKPHRMARECRVFLSFHSASTRSRWLCFPHAVLPTQARQELDQVYKGPGFQELQKKIDAGSRPDAPQEAKDAKEAALKSGVKAPVRRACSHCGPARSVCISPHSMHSLSSALCENSIQVLPGVEVPCFPDLADLDPNAQIYLILDAVTKVKDENGSLKVSPCCRRRILNASCLLTTLSVLTHLRPPLNYCASGEPVREGALQRAAE